MEVKGGQLFSDESFIVEGSPRGRASYELRFGAGRAVCFCFVPDLVEGPLQGEAFGS